MQRIWVVCTVSEMAVRCRTGMVKGEVLVRSTGFLKQTAESVQTQLPALGFRCVPFGSRGGRKSCLVFALEARPRRCNVNLP